jgi:hypothetical protein
MSGAYPMDIGAGSFVTGKTTVEDVVRESCGKRARRASGEKSIPEHRISTAANRAKADRRLDVRGVASRRKILRR